MSAAIGAFWAKGFAATTLSDLEDATGVDRSTLYNSFEGKEGLYRAATAAYLDRADDELFAPLYEGTDGIADVIEFIDRLRDNLRSGANPPGCLIVNDMACATAHEATGRYLRSLEGGLRLALGRASRSGEADAVKADARCQFLCAAVVGINLVSRNGGDNVAALALIDGVRAEVSSWGGPADRERRG